MQKLNSTLFNVFDSDKLLMRTLLNSFGSVIVFVFYSDVNEESKEFVDNFTSSAAIFGLYENVKYFTVEASKCPQTFTKFEIQVTPTVLVTQTNKKILKKYENPQDIGAIFDELSTQAENHKQQFESDKKIWYPKIDSILASCPVIIFIKGTPENPKCGFTRTLLQILKNHNIEFTYYDIIEDENMRYWLRQYKEWPTYPQLYVNQKFLGGLDLIKESVAKGQFTKEFSESCKQQEPEKKYKALISEHESIALIPKFGFESKQIESFLKKASENHPNLYVCNVGLDSKLAEHIQGVQKLTLPALFVGGKLVEKVE